MRIFIGPHEITGQYRNLAIAIRKLGVNCEYYTLEYCPFEYGGDLGNLKLPMIIRKLGKIRKTLPFVSRKICSLFIELLRFVFFIECICRYDVFIFGFGHSLLRYNLDLPLLRMLKKHIIANMSHGSDMTLPYIDGAFLNMEGKMPPLSFLYMRSKELKSRIKKFERYSDYLIGSPLSSSFLATKPYINIFYIGRVSQANHFSPVIANSQVSKSSENMAFQFKHFKILHAPSHAPGKGSNIIRRIIQNLIELGYRIDFREIMGVTNDIVAQELNNCDFVVDQVYADLPMSGLATEAACFGKPSILAGYGLDELSKMVHSQRFPPSIICHPEGLEATILELIQSPEKIFSLGALAKKFVASQWSEKNVALNYLKLISKQPVPLVWWHDPRDLIYLHGYGLSETASAEMVRKMIEAYGLKGLGLEHRPDLEQAFKEYSTKGL